MSAFTDYILGLGLQNMAAFYMLDDANGATTAPDLSGAGNTGSYVGFEGFSHLLQRPSMVEGHSGAWQTGLSPNPALSSWVQADPFTILQTSGITALFFHEHVDTGAEQVILHYATSVELREFVIGIDASGQYWLEFRGEPRHTFDGDIFPYAGGVDRRFIGITKDTLGRALLVINGKLEDIDTVFSTDLIRTGGVLTLGQQQDTLGSVTGSAYLRGTLQGFQLYATSISQESQAGMLAAASVCPGPYTLHEGKGTVQPDPAITFDPISGSTLVQGQSFVVDVTAGSASGTKIWGVFPTSQAGKTRTEVIFENMAAADGYNVSVTAPTPEITRYTISRVNAWPEESPTVTCEVTYRQSTGGTGIVSETVVYSGPSDIYPPSMKEFT